MTRIIIVTALLVAAMTVNVFAATTDSTTVTVSVTEVQQVDYVGTGASITVGYADWVDGNATANAGASDYVFGEANVTSKIVFTDGSSDGITLTFSDGTNSYGHNTAITPVAGFTGTSTTQVETFTIAYTPYSLLSGGAYDQTATFTISDL